VEARGGVLKGWDARPLGIREASMELYSLLLSILWPLAELALKGIF
jgi:hypothetical protein